MQESLRTVRMRVCAYVLCLAVLPRHLSRMPSTDCSGECPISRRKSVLWMSVKCTTKVAHALSGM